MNPATIRGRGAPRVEVLLLTQATLATAFAAWGTLLIQGKALVPAVGAPALLLLAAVTGRSVARGKRAEGLP